MENRKQVESFHVPPQSYPLSFSLALPMVECKNDSMFQQNARQLSSAVFAMLLTSFLLLTQTLRSKPSSLALFPLSSKCMRLHACTHSFVRSRFFVCTRTRYFAFACARARTVALAHDTRTCSVQCTVRATLLLASIVQHSTTSLTR